MHHHLGNRINQVLEKTLLSRLTHKLGICIEKNNHPKTHATHLHN